MAAITPYFLFPGCAREALNFYQEVFDGSLELHTFKDFGRSDGPEEAIAHGLLVAGPIQLFAADAAQDEQPFRSEGLMFSLLGVGDPVASNNWFTKLSFGGQIKAKLEPRPWGASDGQVIDKFGVHWLIGFEQLEEI